MLYGDPEEWDGGEDHGEEGVEEGGDGEEVEVFGVDVEIVEGEGKSGEEKRYAGDPEERLVGKKIEEK